MKIKFGAAGNPLNFFNSEFKKDRFGVLEWSAKLGLNAQERQMTYGARMKEEDAVKFKVLAKKFKIDLSIHGPYYVVLTSLKEEVEKKSIKELVKTTRLAKLMGAKRVVVHPGFYSGRKPEEVLKQFNKNIKLVEQDKEKGVAIYPEVMGKCSQFGSVEDVISICERTECNPCIDWGHVYARSLGKKNGRADFRKVLEEVEKRLGKSVLNNLHCHFAPMEFTDKGEKKHRAVMEKDAEPKFSSLGGLIKEFKMYPTLISESTNSQDIGAIEMKREMTKLNWGV